MLIILGPSYLPGFYRYLKHKENILFFMPFSYNLFFFFFSLALDKARPGLISWSALLHCAFKSTRRVVGVGLESHQLCALTAIGSSSSPALPNLVQNLTQLSIVWPTTFAPAAGHVCSFPTLQWGDHVPRCEADSVFLVASRRESSFTIVDCWQLRCIHLVHRPHLGLLFGFWITSDGCRDVWGRFQRACSHCFV